MRALVLSLTVVLLVRATVAQKCTRTGHTITVQTQSNFGTPTQCSGFLADGASPSGTRMCGFIDDRAAERACWDSAVNLMNDARPVNSGNQEQRRYKCFARTGTPVTLVNTAGMYYGLNAKGTIGTSCTTGDPDCFFDCHVTGAGAGSPLDGSSTALVISSDCDNNPEEVAIGCNDINECTAGVFYGCTGPYDADCQWRKACGPNADCTNSEGSFMCTCATGYVEGTAGDAYKTAGCIDEDECTTGPPCGANGQCQNTVGSYVCLCDAGYVWNHATPACEPNTCSNTPPTIPGGNGDLVGSIDAPVHYTESITYACDNGYEPTVSADGTTFELTCRDDGQYCQCSIPACRRKRCGLPDYDPNANTDVVSVLFGDTLTFTCLPGFKAHHDTSYTVDCLATGYWSVPISGCTDVDECATDPNACPAHSTCFNSIGSHHCICDPGYQFNPTRTACNPVPCGSIPDFAHASRTTLGSAIEGFYTDIIQYRCDSGYQLASNDNPNAVVTTFYIECKQSGHWSPKPLEECIPVTCGDPGDILHSARSAGSFYYGDEISYTCVEGYRPSDHHTVADSTYRTFKTICGADGKWDNQGTHCTDINECQEKTHPCGLGEHICINTEGSYTCSCEGYFRLDQTGQNCVGFPDKPVHQPCDVYDSLHICNGGECYYTDTGVPRCKCHYGYDGSFCDRPVIEQEEKDGISLELTMTIVSMSFATLALIFALIAGFCLCCGARSAVTTYEKHIDHVDHGPVYHQRPGLAAPAVGGYMMAMRDKCTGQVYGMQQ